MSELGQDKLILAMDHLILIRSVMHSNHIAGTRYQEGIMGSDHQALRVRGRDNTITPAEE